MKKIALLLLIVVALFSCNKKQSVDLPKTATIVGTITNSASDNFTIRPQSVIRVLPDTIHFAADGKFSKTLDIAASGYYSIRLGQKGFTIYLKPGDSLVIAFDDSKKTDAVQFEGVGAAENTYLAKKSLFDSENEIEAEQLFALDESTFVAALDSVSLVEEKFVSEYFEKNTELEKNFVTLEKSRGLYKKAQQRLTYPSYHSYLTKDKYFKVSKNFYEFKTMLNLNDKNLLALTDYRTTLSTIVENKYDEAFKKDSTIENKMSQIKFDAIDKDFTDTEVKNFLYYNVINEQLSYYSADSVDHLITRFTQTCTDSLYEANITELYTKWQTLASGNAAPIFTYNDITGKSVSLSDFKGKYVYIDVWATWCGPCRQEIPFLTTIEKEYAKKNIVFVKVSVDTDKMAWETMVKEQKLTGTQLYAGGWDTPIANDYVIKSIPRFILIDKEGKIIDATAVRPSGNLREVLNALKDMGV